MPPSITRALREAQSLLRPCLPIALHVRRKTRRHALPQHASMPQRGNLGSAHHAPGEKARKEQVEDGSLVIRKMTEEERKRYPVRPAPAKKTYRR